MRIHKNSIEPKPITIKFKGGRSVDGSDVAKNFVKAISDSFVPPPTSKKFTYEQQTIILNLEEYTDMIRQIATLEERHKNFTLFYKKHNQYK